MRNTHCVFDKAMSALSAHGIAQPSLQWMASVFTQEPFDSSRQSKLLDCQDMAKLVVEW